MLLLTATSLGVIFNKKNKLLSLPNQSEVLARDGPEHLVALEPIAALAHRYAL